MNLRTASSFILIAGSLLLAACDREAPATPKAGDQPPPGWRTFGDATRHFSVAYPEGWAVDAHYEYALGPGGVGERPSGVSFTVPGRLAANTNLSADTKISVETLPNNIDCSAVRFLDAANNVHQINEYGHDWDVGSQGEGAMGNFYDESVFVIPKTSPCIAVRYFIHSTNIGDYDPGTVKQFDRASLVAMFDRIRSTLAITRSGGQ